MDEKLTTFDGIHDALLTRFRRPGPWRHLDPVSQLVMGIIGGRTTGSASLAGFERLVLQFGRWEHVRDGAPDGVFTAIAEVTFAEAKAPRLQAALQNITALKGALTLDFLGDWSVEGALEWLERLPGVGRKVSAATLNFSSLRMNALVIDTHHLRILRRLGLVRPKANIMDAYQRVMPRLPLHWHAADFDDHHQLMKTLGQKVCRRAAPLCCECPLQKICPTGGLDTGRHSNG